jgi:hypothetical protein
VEQSGHDDEYLYKFDADAQRWAEGERDRDLMAILIEAAHLKSAARAWYRRRGPDAANARYASPGRLALPERRVSRRAGRVR